MLFYYVANITRWMFESQLKSDLKTAYNRLARWLAQLIDSPPVWFGLGWFDLI